MAAFDDSFDPDLGAACNRLAAMGGGFARRGGDRSASDLTEDDLALILRHLYATRRQGQAGQPVDPAPSPAARASVPVTAKS